MATANEPTLEDRIQALPQEMKDMILDFTVAVKPDQTVVIDREHKAPWQLQVNSATRKQYAPTYFRTSKFQSDPLHFYIGTFAKWLQAQSSSHRAIITTIRYESGTSPEDWAQVAALYGWVHIYEVAITVVARNLQAEWGWDPIALLEFGLQARKSDGEIKRAWAKQKGVGEAVRELGLK